MQQVNLYVPELRPKREWISAKFSAISVGALLLLVCALIGSAVNTIGQYEKKLNVLELQLAALKSEAESLKKKPASHVKVDLERRIKIARDSIENRRQIESVLSGRNMGNSLGFSGFFLNLSEQVPEGVSVKQFSISEGGKRAGLLGGSLESESIPLLIDRLQETEAFSDTTFGALSITQQGGVSAFRVGRFREDEIEGAIDSL